MLESFKIMDYSLLMGVHNIDLESSGDEGGGGPDACGSSSSTADDHDQTKTSRDYQIAAKTEAWKQYQLDFNTSKGPYELVLLSAVCF